jgi:ADP-ribosyl-[dinitrogen reductase] hydrolase
MTSLQSRYAGTLVDAACGDALGATLEFRSRETVRRMYPDGLRDIVGGGAFNVAPGETTDETAMMLGIARACTADGIDMDAAAANFMAWWESGPKDIGNATRWALEKIQSGMRWQDAGEEMQAETPNGVAGNGSVMRIAPLPLRFRSSPERMVVAALDSSRITHADSRAMWGCVAVSQAIVHLLEGGGIEGVVEAASRDIPVAEVIAAVEAARDLPYRDVRSNGYVLSTITAALWCLLRGSDAEDVVVRAVMMGDDADTTGIVAGALAGAAFGLEAIPERWRAVVHHREELEEIASRLLAWDRADARQAHRSTR